MTLARSEILPHPLRIKPSGNAFTESSNLRDTSMGLFARFPGVGGSTLSTSHLGRFMVFVYIWLPFMILPIQASLERLPPSLLQASADLGAKPRLTFMQVILPLSMPGFPDASNSPYWEVHDLWTARYVYAARIWRQGSFE